MKEQLISSKSVSSAKKKTKMGEVAPVKQGEAMTGGAAAKGPVVVTGASGFLGSWLVMKLLQAGYTVRATVRDPGELICLSFFCRT